MDSKSINRFFNSKKSLKIKKIHILEFYTKNDVLSQIFVSSEFSVIEKHDLCVVSKWIPIFIFFGIQKIVAKFCNSFHWNLHKILHILWNFSQYSTIFHRLISKKVVSLKSWKTRLTTAGPNWSQLQATCWSHIFFSTLLHRKNFLTKFCVVQ